MAVRVTHASTVTELAADTVTFIIATRFHGGDVNVTVRLDDKYNHTFLATVENPTVLVELVGIDKIGTAAGPMTINHVTNPASYSVKRGDVGGVVFKF